ncbi:thiol-disulfide oxidoreductase DCC family protein [Thalassobium sp. R2A62]|uniref:thiol-disulfide oxidoreductase DCC family protein n=1 Tax=Thalassobium sp. R2A62 TaxID=633131 RepID=UPI00350E373E
MQGNVGHSIHRRNMTGIGSLSMPSYLCSNNNGAYPLAKLEVLYNDDCPICRREIKHYAGLSDGSVAFVKITEQSAADWGLTEEQAAKQIHARSDGNVTVGVDAFVSVWKQLPYYRLLALVIGWRPIRYITDAVYRKVLAPLLFAMHKRRQRRQAGSIR